MTTRRTVAADIGRLAGEVRTEVGRLAYHLRTPATRSGITPTRLAALSALTRYPDGVRQGDLAELMNISAPSMTRLVEIMEEAGWVERRRDPADQRCLLLVLTPVGHTTIDTLRDEAATQLSTELADLTEDERIALAAAVPVLRKLADRHLDG
ncbi:MarR family winged helix-turn-helix transcriptional regulator [Nostocoides sp. HKS02]|uniref:MarR family winged helix-turn-helix transcriptional regulator n=1 Tax=Nostocoides sp. HKS02 TaxID=1813880 RepID=UPI0012B45B11|nr:MarR family transcriptional regulator [Tetrasphaera sp. HKS02]QGN59234.1 MarR family transcriptional regulator [Tetrasphaera sp. HKS02]